MVVCELKHSHADHDFAVGQVVCRMQALFELQPHRAWCYGVVGGGSWVEVLLFERVPTSTLFQIKRSEVLPFTCRADSEGLQLLVSLLHASPIQLGFKPAELESE